MRYDDFELLDRIAREYVVGTLRGRARRRFEKLLSSNETARLRVREWEDRLLPLSLDLEPVSPQASVWQGIETRLDDRAARGGARAEPRDSLIRRFRWAFAAMLAVAAVGLGWLVLTSPGSPTAIAVLAPEGQPPIWNVETFPDRESIRIVALSPVPVQPGKTYELWALPEGGAPVSLGLMPPASETRRLSAAQLAALAASKQVAVSLEPPGGSPTGAPTGPVLYVGAITQAT
jgi:anti-sigma-K factor RskA